MDLWIMNADGGGRHALVHENNKYSDGAYPAWSPDGTTIAFTANNGSGYYHVWSIPVSGGQNTELITNRVLGEQPSRPAGRLAADANEGGSEDAHRPRRYQQARGAVLL